MLLERASLELMLTCLQFSPAQISCAIPPCKVSFYIGTHHAH